MKNTQKLREKIYRLRFLLSSEVDNSTMGLIDELVELEIELEAECNQ